MTIDGLLISETMNVVCVRSNSSNARIGITDNNENGCTTCNSGSRIGFGTGGNFDDSNTSGNEAV